MVITSADSLSDAGQGRHRKPSPPDMRDAMTKTSTGQQSPGA
jgi:hypothetical protein